jgi:hypothetical protein
MVVLSDANSELLEFHNETNRTTEAARSIIGIVQLVPTIGR